MAATILACGVEVTFAQGALDFLDPCKKQEAQFASTSDALRARADEFIAEWDNLSEPPGELRPEYVEMVRVGLYTEWAKSPQIVPLLDTLRRADPKFDAQKFFLENVYPKAVTQEAEAEYVRQIFKIVYNARIRPAFLADREKLEQKIQGEKETLDQACKPDVFNQVFRGTVGNLTLIYKGNEEAAKNEKGEIAKAIRLTSGISLTDIEKNGLLGGENSELRKLANGIAGGENSEVNKIIKGLDQNLNPANWKVEIPPVVIKVPDIEIKVEPPTITLPGGTRLCVPWC